MHIKIKALIVTIILVLCLLLYLVQKNSLETTSLIPAEYTIQNQGGNMEGHTPRGFSGSGPGLFLGDNLNPQFPNTDGIQLFLTFDISDVSGDIKKAILRSDKVVTTGDPFNDLGKVLVEQVSYDSFSQKVWNTKSLKDVCSVDGLQEGVFICDITETLVQVKKAGDLNLQFRLRFQKISDQDNDQDMLLFYDTNANQNKSGIFSIRVNNIEDFDPLLDSDVSITLPAVLHRVVDSGDISTTRDIQNIEELFSETQRIWKQANIEFDMTIVDTEVPLDMQEEISNGNFKELYQIFAQDDLAFHIFFLNSIGGPNGATLPPLLSVVPDITSVNDYRATAHEIGHLLNLQHTNGSRDALLFQGVNGEALSEQEITVAREYAETFKNEIDRRQ